MDWFVLVSYSGTFVALAAWSFVGGSCGIPGRGPRGGARVYSVTLDAGATLTSDPTPVGVAPYGRPTRVRLRQQQHADRWRAFDTASRSIEQRLRYRRVPPVCTPNETSKRNRPGVKPSFSPVCSHDVPLGTRRLRLLPGDPCASSHRIESVSRTGTTST